MKRSTERILTTHVGSLARPDALVPILTAKDRGEPYDGDAYARLVREAWDRNGEVIVVHDDEEAAAVADEYAPEHLEVQTRNLDWYLARLRNYGSLFLGEESTVAYSVRMRASSLATCCAQA